MKKHSFSMRLFSVLLCLAMLCTVAPFASVSAETEATGKLLVGGVEVSRENANDVLGDGTVAYNPKTNTLTLSDATISATGTMDGIGDGIILSDGDLNIVLNGMSDLKMPGTAPHDVAVVIGVNGDLVISGTGALTCCASKATTLSCAIWATGSVDLCMSDRSEDSVYKWFGAYNRFQAGVAAESYAVCAGGEITCSPDGCNAEFSGETRAFKTTPTIKKPYMGCYAFSEKANDKEFGFVESDALPSNLDAYRTFVFCIEEFTVSVCNVEVTPENADDVLGDGTVSYDFEKNELTLNNATLTEVCTNYNGETDVAAVYASGDLTVRLIGDNMVDIREPGLEKLPEYSQCFYVQDLTFVGDGNLTCYAGNAKDTGTGVWADVLTIRGSGDYAFIANPDDAYSDAGFYGVHVYDYDELGMLYVSGTAFDENEDHGCFFAGLSGACCYDFVYYDGEYRAYVSDKMDDTAMEELNDSFVTCDNKRVYLKSIAPYVSPVWVNGVEVTEENAADVLKDGTVSYDFNERELTLSNATLTQVCDQADSGDCAAIFSRDMLALTIRLVGENTIDLTGDLDYEDKIDYLQAIECSNAKEVNLIGDGSLSIQLPDAAMETYGAYLPGAYVWIDDGVTLEVNAENSAKNSYGVWCSSFYNRSPHVKLVANIAAISDNEFRFDSSLVCLGADSYDGTLKDVSDSVSESDVRSDLKHIEFKKFSYNVFVNGVEITPDNEFDVLGDGTVAYSSYDNRLMLANAHITAGHVVAFDEDYALLAGIYCESDTPLTILLNGQNTIDIAGDSAVVAGVYAGKSVCIDDGHGEFAGNLDITVGAAEQACGILAGEVTFRQSGDVSVTMEEGSAMSRGVFTGEGDLRFSCTGDVTVSVGATSKEACAVYSKGSLIQDNAGKVVLSVDGAKDDAMAAYCAGSFVSGGVGTMDAVAGPADKNSYGLKVSGDFYIFNAASSSYAFQGVTQAVKLNSEKTISVEGFELQASETIEESELVESPSLENLEDYPQVWFTPLCSFEPIDDYVVKAGDTVPLSWTLNSEVLPDYYYILADDDNDGTYDVVLQEIEGSNTSFDCPTVVDEVYDLSFTSFPWQVAAVFGGQLGDAETTTVYSDPFKVTVYYNIDDDMGIVVENFAVGQTASDAHISCYPLFEVLRNNPTFTWYEFGEDDIATQLGENDRFEMGCRYGVKVTAPLVEFFGLDESTAFEILNDVGGEVTDVQYDLETYTATIYIAFEPLKEMLEMVVASYVTPNDDLTLLTPNELNLIAAGILSGTENYVTINRSPVTAKLFYCEGTAYNPEAVMELAPNKRLQGGRYYFIEMTIPLKNGMAFTNDTNVFVNPEPPYDSEVNETLYDEETNTLTLVRSIGALQETITDVACLLDEPEPGLTPSKLNCCFVGLDEQIADYGVSWYECPDGSEPISMDASSDVFEEGKTYMAEIDFHMNTDVAYLDDDDVTFTINGEPASVFGYNEVEAAIYTVFAPLAESEKVTALDFSITLPVAGDFARDANTYSFDTETLAFGTLSWYKYDEDVKNFIPLDDGDAFQEGVTYGAQIDFAFKAGFAADETLVDHMTMNGEEPFLKGAYTDERSGFVCWSGEVLPAPVVTVTAPAVSEFTCGDEALAAVTFDVAYTFEPEIEGMSKRVLVSVTDEYGNDMGVGAAYASAVDSIAVDMSGEDFTDGTYAVTVTAFFRDKQVVSNAATVLLTPAPTTTTTETETEPTATNPPVAELSATITAPVAGEKPDYTAIAGGSGYVSEVYPWYVVDGDDFSPIVDDTAVFEAGKEYVAIVWFEPLEGVLLSDEATATINGVDAELWSYMSGGARSYYVIFTAVEAPTEPSVTATEVEPTVTETEPSVTASKETTEPTAKPTVAPTASKETTKPTTEPTVAPTESKEPTVTEVTPTVTETEPTIAPTEVEPTATATGTGTDVPSFILYGDANNDGVVNMKDVLALRKHIAGIEILIHPLNSDANADNEINMKDVLAVRKFIAGIVTELGPDM